MEVIVVVGIGTIVNAISIIGGALVGFLLRKGLPQRIKELIMQAIGLSVIVVGLSGVLQGVFQIVDSRLERQHLMMLIICMVSGAIIGGVLRIEERLDRVGRWFQARLGVERRSQGENYFAQGFVFASLLYCVGAMAIVGALEDGLMQDPTTLFSKSVLDGISAVVFTTTIKQYSNVGKKLLR